jgi:hypothetical protein
MRNRTNSTIATDGSPKRSPQAEAPVVGHQSANSDTGKATG